MRVRRQIEQDIFAQIRREIDELRPGQFEMKGESFRLDVEWKQLETADALELDRLSELATGPQCTFRNSHVERVAKRSGAAHIFCREIGDRRFFLALEMQTVGVNLSEMDFHRLSLFRSALATLAGTNSVTSPPSRAISFTILELR